MRSYSYIVTVVKLDYIVVRKSIRVNTLLTCVRLQKH